MRRKLEMSYNNMLSVPGQMQSSFHERLKLKSCHLKAMGFAG